MKLNGNIPNINLGLSVGVISLLVFTIIVGGFYINETKLQSEKNTKFIDILDNKTNTFIDNWNKRIQISNKIQNTTQDRLLTIGRRTTERI